MTPLNLLAWTPAEAAQILDAAAMARDGYITREELLADIEVVTGPLEVDADFTPDKSARLNFRSAGAARR